MQDPPDWLDKNQYATKHGLKGGQKALANELAKAVQYLRGKLDKNQHAVKDELETMAKELKGEFDWLQDFLRRRLPDARDLQELTWRA